MSRCPMSKADCKKWMMLVRQTDSLEEMRKVLELWLIALKEIAKRSESR